MLELVSWPVRNYDIRNCHAVICVSIVCGLIVLCMLRRLIQHYYPNALLIYPVAPRMERRQPSEGACNLCFRFWLLHWKDLMAPEGLQWVKHVS